MNSCSRTSKADNQNKLKKKLKKVQATAEGKVKEWEAARRKRFNEVIFQIQKELPKCSPGPKIDTLQAALLFIRDQKAFCIGKNSQKNDKFKDATPSTRLFDSEDQSQISKLKRQIEIQTFILREARVKIDMDEKKNKLTYFIPVFPSNYLESCKIRKVILDLTSVNLDKENICMAVSSHPTRKNSWPNEDAQEKSITTLPEFQPIIVENLSPMNAHHNRSHALISKPFEDVSSNEKSNEILVVDSEETKGMVTVKLIPKTNTQPAYYPKDCMVLQEASNLSCKDSASQVQTIKKPQMIYLKCATLDDPLLKKQENNILVPQLQDSHFYVTPSQNQAPIMSTGLGLAGTFPRGTFIHISDVIPSPVKLKRIAPKPVFMETNVQQPLFISPKKRSKTFTDISIKSKKCKLSTGDSVISKSKSSPYSNALVSSCCPNKPQAVEASLVSSQTVNSDDELEAMMDLPVDIPCAIADDLPNNPLEKDKLDEMLLQSINEESISQPSMTALNEPTKVDRIVTTSVNSLFAKESTLDVQASTHSVSVGSSNYSIMSLCMPSKSDCQKSNSIYTLDASCHGKSKTILTNVNKISDEIPNKESKNAKQTSVAVDLNVNMEAVQSTPKSIGSAKILDLPPRIDCIAHPKNSLTLSLIPPPAYLSTPFAGPPLPPLGLPTLTLAPLPISRLPSTANFNLLPTSNINSIAIPMVTPAISSFLLPPLPNAIVTTSAASTSSAEILSNRTSLGMREPTRKKVLPTSKPNSLVQSSTSTTLTTTSSSKLELQIPPISILSTASSTLEPIISKTIFSLAPITSYAHPFSFCALPLSDAPTTFSFTLTRNPSSSTSTSSSEVTVSDSLPKFKCSTSTQHQNTITSKASYSNSILNPNEISSRLSVPKMTVSSSISSKISSVCTTATISVTTSLPTIQSDSTSKSITSSSNLNLSKPSFISAAMVSSQYSTSSTLPGSNSPSVTVSGYCNESEKIVTPNSESRNSSMFTISKSTDKSDQPTLNEFKLPLLPLSSYLLEDSISPAPITSGIAVSSIETISSSKTNVSVTVISGNGKPKTNFATCVSQLPTEIEKSNKSIESREDASEKSSTNVINSPLRSITRMFNHVDKTYQLGASGVHDPEKNSKAQTGILNLQEKPLDFTAQIQITKSSNLDSSVPKGTSADMVTVARSTPSKPIKSQSNVCSVSVMSPPVSCSATESVPNNSSKETTLLTESCKANQEHPLTENKTIIWSKMQALKSSTSDNCIVATNVSTVNQSSLNSPVSHQSNEAKNTKNVNSTTAVSCRSELETNVKFVPSVGSSPEKCRNSSTKEMAVNLKENKNSVACALNCAVLTTSITSCSHSSNISSISKDVYNSKPQINSSKSSDSNVSCFLKDLPLKAQQSNASFCDPNQHSTKCSFQDSSVKSSHCLSGSTSKLPQDRCTSQAIAPVTSSVHSAIDATQIQSSQQQGLHSQSKTNSMAQIQNVQTKQAPSHVLQGHHLQYSVNQKQLSQSGISNTASQKENIAQPIVTPQQQLSNGQQHQQLVHQHSQHIHPPVAQQSNSMHQQLQPNQNPTYIQSLNNYESPMVENVSERPNIKGGHVDQHHHSPMGSGYDPSFDYNPYYRKAPQSPRGEGRHNWYGGYKQTSQFQQDILAEGGPTASNPIISPMYLDGTEEMSMRGVEEQTSEHLRGFSVSHLVSPFSDSRKPNNVSVKELSNMTNEKSNKDSPKKSHVRKGETKSRASTLGTPKSVAHSMDARRRSPARSMSGQTAANTMWNSSKTTAQKQCQNYSAEALISTGSQNYSRVGHRQASNQNYHFMPHNQMYQSSCSPQQMKNLVQNPSFGYPGPERTGICNPDYNLQLHTQSSGSFHYGANVPYMPHSYSYQNIPQTSSTMLSTDFIPSSHPSTSYPRLSDINAENSNFTSNATFPLPIEPDMCGVPPSASSMHVRMTGSDASFNITSSYSRAASGKASGGGSSTAVSSGNPGGKRSRYSDPMIASGMGTPTPSNFLEGSALSHISLHSFTPPCEDPSIMHSNFFPGSTSRHHQSNFLLGSENFVPLNSPQYPAPNANGGYSIIGGSMNHSLPSNGAIGMGPPARSGPMSHMLPPHASSSHVSFNPLKQQVNMVPTAPVGPHLSSSLSNFNLTSIFPEIDGKNEEPNAGMSVSRSLSNNESINSTQSRISTMGHHSKSILVPTSQQDGGQRQLAATNNMNNIFPNSSQVNTGIHASSLALPPFAGINFSSTE